MYLVWSTRPGIVCSLIGRGMAVIRPHPMASVSSSLACRVASQACVIYLTITLSALSGLSGIPLRSHRSGSTDPQIILQPDAPNSSDPFSRQKRQFIKRVVFLLESISSTQLKYRQCKQKQNSRLVKVEIIRPNRRSQEIRGFVDSTCQFICRIISFLTNPTT